MNHSSLLFAVSRRKSLFATGLFLLGLASSCKKEETKVPSYRVSGLPDLTLNRNPFEPGFGENPYKLNFEIKAITGQSQNVQLSVVDLPAGFSDSLSVRNGRPTFGSSLFLKDAGAAAGQYRPRLQLEVEDGSTLSYPFKIALSGYGTCVDYFQNRQLAVELIPANMGTPFKFKSALVRQGVNSDTVLIRNFNNNGEDLKVVFNCATYRLEIPFQLTNRGFIRGYNGFIGILGTGMNGMPLGFNFGVQEVVNNVQSSYSLYYTFE